MRRNKRTALKKSNGAVICWMLLVLAVCIAVKILTVSGVGSRLEENIKVFLSTEEGTEAILQMEFGISESKNSIYKLLNGKHSEDDAVDVSQMNEEETEHNAESAIPEYYIDKAATQDKKEKLVYTGENIFEDNGWLDSASIILDNDTGLEINVDELLNSPLSFTVKAEEPAVLIVHTHGSEAYTADSEDMYVESDPYRTEDSNYNVVRVGEELKKELESYGISVLHDTTLHDYPSYNGSYNRSFETIAKYIEEYPTIKIVIDLHRDAIANEDGTQYRTAVQIGEEMCSQLLFVMGTDASGLEHPAWRENMKLAVKLQYAMNIMYPNLAKPICVSQYRYNQHMTSGSMILEVGSTGNTLKESINSMKYFAAAAAQVIKSASEKDN